MNPENTSPDVVAIVTDLVGTTVDATTAADDLPRYVRAHPDDPAVVACLDALREQAGEPEADVERVLAELAAQLPAADPDAPPVGSDRVADPDIAARIHADAAAGLQAWADDHRALFVYAAVPAPVQRLMLACSDRGDLGDLFGGHFDTRMGGTTHQASYRAIAEALGERPAALLFLSSRGDALDAAAAAGWQTCWIARDDAAAERAERRETHPWVPGFDAIELL